MRVIWVVVAARVNDSGGVRKGEGLDMYLDKVQWHGWRS